MVSSEDFSFPKITNPLPHFAISPSLWRVSSIVYPDYCHEDDGRSELDFSKRSFSFTAGEVQIGSSEEKMDMLWENFNEQELLRASFDNSLGSKKTLLDDSLDSESGRQFCCVKKDLRMSKSDKYRQRQSIFMVFKALKKKIFLLHSSSTKNHQKL